MDISEAIEILSLFLLKHEMTSKEHEALEMAINLLILEDSKDGWDE